MTLTASVFDEELRSAPVLQAYEDDDEDLDDFDDEDLDDEDFDDDYDDEDLDDDY